MSCATPILPSGSLGHVPETTGHVAEITGHDPETAGHVRPKYARITEAESLAAEKALSDRLQQEIRTMRSQLELFTLYEKVAADSKLTLEEMRQLFPEDV